MKIFRLIATPVILLGLLGLLIYAANWGWKALTEPLPSPSPTPCVTQSASVVAPSDVSVRIFNGGFTSGLANRISRSMKEVGFKVVRVDNTDERIKTTIIRGNEEQLAELTLVASYFNEATIEHDDRVDGTVDVLVGSEYKDMNPSPMPEAPATAGVICVVPSASPSAAPSTAVTPTAPASPAATPEG
ncbi:MAG TPA: LytR C-terminal domain-containing protein [Tessaracoccus flavescens]|uniref:LytR C-terminal domain-containing protein n=1 Tax=Tessaracoccus flavescens TaxID=399497 RepID=A0A921ENI5_9ACTN|nr:LytR C-terminal domain-containing protein [Tessaracoccus flavescens]